MLEFSPKPRIALGSDHAGQFLENFGYPVDDLGTWSEESDAGRRNLQSWCIRK
jgi:hypothetical protein